MNACLKCKKARLTLKVRKVKLPEVFRVFLAKIREEVIVFGIEVSNTAILLNS